MQVTNSSRYALLILAPLLALGCESRSQPSVESASPATAASAAADVPVFPPTEVFLATARRGEPAELRLRQGTQHRYELTTRAAVAAVIKERAASKVRVRHGADVPQSELDELVEFLRSQGVEHIEYKVAPKPPSNPRSDAGGD